jgi:hypothetical protein
MTPDQNPLNPHLNLFRFFNDTLEQEYIENNLSRAFALCIKNDALFFSHYVQAIVSPEDYDYLFSVHSKDDGYFINIQQNMNAVDVDGIRKVYAVAMTTDEGLNMADFETQTLMEGRERHVTDVWILIKDMALVIEVKGNAADCKQQLFNQVALLRQTEGSCTILPRSFSWHKVIGVMEKVNALNKMTGIYNPFIEDFLLLTQSRYPDWFPAKPFWVLPFSEKDGSAAYSLLNKRLAQCVAKSDYQLAGFSNRLAIAVPFDWASEVQVAFQTYEASNEKDYIVFYIWPGNTKGQGWSIYGRPMDWLQKEQIVIDGRSYELEIAFNIKFAGQRFISGITFYRHDLRGPLIHTDRNFREKSGRWYLKDWGAFESFLDEHFLPEFNWRDKCQWQQNFLERGRTQFQCSFGFEVTLFVPFAEFAAIDRRMDDAGPAATKLNKIIAALGSLLNYSVT